jgi:hypothetical protein
MERRFESKEFVDIRKGAVKALRKYPVKALATEDRKNLELMRRNGTLSWTRKKV